MQALFIYMMHPLLKLHKALCLVRNERCVKLLLLVYNLQMAQGMQCLHAISNYMRKVELKYQHVIGHNYATIWQFKESRDKKTIYRMSYPVSRV